MFSHMVVGSNDLEKSRHFYNAIFSISGIAAVASSDCGRLMYPKGEQFFLVVKPLDGKAATAGNGHTIGLELDSPEQVDAWHKIGVEHGGVAIENPPGIREISAMKLYLAYLRDPDGNKLCAFHKIV